MAGNNGQTQDKGGSTLGRSLSRKVSAILERDDPQFDPKRVEQYGTPRQEKNYSVNKAVNVILNEDLAGIETPTTVRKLTKVQFIYAAL